jgi:hypothetical protein
MSRTQLFLEICKLVGNPPVTVKNPATGWPGIVEVVTPSGKIFLVALHVSTVGGHARKDYELRFQNPGGRNPVQALKNSLPLLLGLYVYQEKPILVGVDGHSRVGRFARFSILFHKRLIEEAAARGWAVYTSSTGENIYAFNPALLPILVEIVASGIEARPAISTSHKIADAIIASGLLDDDSEPARERARRAAEVPVRHHAFGKVVVSLYDGHCAMCGLDYGLLAGAHIYPVGAPGSPDKAWNGIALCPNHHAVFDAHKIWVEPNSYKIAIHPSLIDEIEENNALKALVGTTYAKLAKPNETAALPKPEMFERRYDYFEGQYDWAN